jgi:2-aminoadipate transaminase
MATIPFTRGVPGPSMLPVDDLKAAAVAALEQDPAAALAYGPGGYLPLREWIGERHGVDASRVLLVNGSLQGLAYIAQHLFLGSPGRALVEDPTYDRTLKSLRTFGATPVPVPVTDDGLDVDALERALGEGARPELLYLIPTFQNPGGTTLPAEGRRRVVELCREAGVLVLEDDPYGLLRFEGEPAPSLHELDGGDNVIYTSSFTKTIAPGVRTGYMVLPERLVAPLGTISENSCIGPNTFAEATLNAYCRAGRFEPNVARATAMLRERRDAMAEALREHFPETARWRDPQGGYFTWVELGSEIDTGALLAEATRRGVPYVKGADFSASGGCRSAVRLAFSYPEPDQIREGVARLGELFSEAPAPAPVA